jgi:hypothetical protein
MRFPLGLPAAAAAMLAGCLIGGAEAGPSPVGSTAYEAAHLFSATKANLVDFSIVNHTASVVWLIVLDAAAIPADGAIAAGTLKYCQPVTAATGSIDGGLGVSYRDDGAYYQNGIVVLASTAGCLTKTTSGVQALFFARAEPVS